MNLKQVQSSIKLSLSIINKAIRQIPLDKRPIITSRVNAVLNKYLKGPESQPQLIKFQKQLEFNLNFIKLSHPNLDFTPEESPKQQQNSKPKESTNTNNNQEEEHKVKFTNEDQMEIQRLKNDVFDTYEDREKKAREQVEFSNWFEGNVDPQMLKKHKELLQRQHFQGQFWKGKQKPQNTAQQYIKAAIASQGPDLIVPKKDKILEDFQPKNIDQSNKVWEKVKR